MSMQEAVDAVMALGGEGGVASHGAQAGMRVWVGGGDAHAGSCHGRHVPL